MRFLKVDPMMVKLIITVFVATILPAKGKFITFFNCFSVLAIALLFFMHGARLSRENIMAGSKKWRLHLWITCSTFIIFPFFGLLLNWWHPIDIKNSIYVGFTYLCILPATVQSSIALTSIAGGNVATAICSASASSLLGVFVSPLLVKLLINIEYDTYSSNLEHIGKIILQLLVPFLLGQLSRRWTKIWIKKHVNIVSVIDQSSIVLVVYLSFSESVLNGIWYNIDMVSLLWILIINLFLLFIMMIINFAASRLFGLSRTDEIVVLFCGSKKSLANGVPMANLLFPHSSVGIILLPLMIFHQLQLMVCSLIAQRYKTYNSSI
ncbi:bile acid:sodium symporter family protein [Candidatus Pantoea carbekii]|uniref:Putative cytochrome oxidase n=1 Tax=Candidatus Pantoea carbekii TaxID=1235990 RepID=U3U2W6_9GAMM|nr:bile acid:sodium symporter family protein [Candidatus Pantoea carbekii]AKC31975.1 cytochrome oxidase YfeH [Candidatus Pantoea carbekii]BAO00496.1 putative cytochrome oxidase [Candidatus Pantoea carbekii]